MEITAQELFNIVAKDPRVIAYPKLINAAKKVIRATPGSLHRDKAIKELEIALRELGEE